MKVIKNGSGSPRVAIVACIHGDETLGKEAIEILRDMNPVRGSVFFIIANEEAMHENKRFIDSDLNRSFPGKEDGNIEERLACSLLKEIAECEFVIDIHSTLAKTAPFVIFTKNDPSIKNLISVISIKKTVYMSPELAKGKALIDHVKCGISIEFNHRADAKETSEIIENALVRIGLISGDVKEENHELYEVYGILDKSYLHTGKFANFSEICIGGEKFYPVLYGAKSYKEITCLKARRVK